MAQNGPRRLPPATTITDGGVRSGDGREAASSPPGAKEVAWKGGGHGETPNPVARAGGALVLDREGRNKDEDEEGRQPFEVGDELEPAEDGSPNWERGKSIGCEGKLKGDTGGAGMACNVGSSWRCPRRTLGWSRGSRRPEGKPLGLGVN